MKKKKHIGELISVKFKDRKNPAYGFVIDYNEEWTLLKYNTVDFLLDGYLIFRHKNIEGIRRNEEEKFIEKVIKLKGLAPSQKETIPLTDIGTILKFLTKKFGVFQFYTKSEKACYLGRVNTIDDKNLVLDFLNPKGKWDGKMEFRLNEIREIEFDTDYINSLKLISKTIKRKK
ncbi:MAG: hypothetical protein M3R17_05655 [Bacteroidota bacterium]|nr:hypothetical protein [Bacteroidota bacterium]